MLRILIPLAALMAASPAHAEEFVSSDLLAAHSPTVQAVAYMDTIVRERTQGRHSIRVLAQSTASTDNFTIERVRSGELAMARVRLATFHKVIPATVVPTLPFLFTSKAHLRRSLDGPVGDEILKALQRQGLIGLCFYDTGPRSFYTSKKPIRNAADLKDMSVRVQSSDVLASLLRSIGARPKPIPFARVYESLKNGAVDAAEFDFQTYEDARHHEVAKFYSMTEHSMAPSVLVFSKKIWDGLSAEDQAIIAAAARESVPYMRSLSDEHEPAARKAVVAAGAEIITDIDKASFSAALVPAYARFVRDPTLKDMIKRIQATDSLRIMR